MSFSSKVKQELAAIPKEDCDKRAYVRDAYIHTGTMAHPKKSYHLEFAITPIVKPRLVNIFAEFNLCPKEHSRNNGDILYFKEAEQIATVLNIMGAHIALMEFENCRIEREVNNAINRVANAAAANEDKKITASARHVKDILDIQRIAGLSSLEKGLADVAKLRLDDRFATLEDIGKKLSPSISKSGVNHRLKKIAQIAESYRGNK
ncbi:MAG: DNA-binding protein WhiA [Defluviitaleaceae bacterium]|nr:DNA-binding protein WhiA [Defluviitaleaceae bacterium]